MDWFNGIAEKLRKAYEGMNPDSAIARNAKKTIQQVDGLVQMWADMAVEAAGNYRNAEAVESNASDGEQKYSIRETDDGRMVAVVDNDVLSHIDTSNWNKAKIDEAKQAARDALSKYSGGIVVNGITRKVNKTSRREFTKSDYTRYLSNNDKETFADKMRMADVAGDVITVTTGWKNDGGLTHPRNDNFVDFDHGAALIMSGSNQYSAEIVVGITDSGEYVFYDVTNINPDTYKIKEEPHTTATTDKPIGDINRGSSGSMVAQDDGTVKHSDRDSDGKELTEGQLAYFQNSKIRDADGNLMVMYRGGHDEFTVFDRKKSSPFNLYGRGFYFTNSEAHAKTYGNAKPFYLNITHPLMQGQNNITRQQMRKFIQAVADNEDDYGLDNYGYGATVASVLKDVWGKGDYEMIWDLNQTAIGDMVAAVELFNEVNGTDYDGLVMPTETVTFQSNQAKNIDNENSSADPDIRFSIRETDDGRMAAVVDDDILSHIDTATWDDSKIEAAKKAASIAFAKFSGGISVDGITRKVNKTSRREYTRSNYTESLAKKDKATFADKMRLADVADDVVTVTTGWQKDGGLLHQRKDNFVDFDHGHALLMAGENKYDAEVVVGIKDNGEYVFYDVVDIAPASFETKKEEPSTTATTGKPIGDIHEDSSKSIVAQDDGTVKHSDRDDYSTLTSKPDMTVIWTRFSSIPIMWKFI